ncbi:hypothetical protein HDU98_003798 [Podochytrium sp. JEL0797]|nr:hypothetical protein HDU98_003798 [Podochytrium sp. JEL0797]
MFARLRPTFSIKQQGPAALLTYSAVSATSFSLCCAGVYGTLSTTATPPETDGIAEFVRIAKDVVRDVEGAIVKGRVRVQEHLDRSEEALRDVKRAVELLDLDQQRGPTHPRTDTIVALAWLAHNVTWPARIGVTAALTPYVARRLRGSYLDAVLARHMATGAANMAVAKSRLAAVLLKIRS